jgi:hypothetical protein
VALALAGLLAGPGSASGQTDTLRSPTGTKAYYLPYSNFLVPFQIFGIRQRVSITNPTGAYVLLVWEDPAAESDSTIWSGYRVRRSIPGINATPLTPGAPNGEVIGQLKARDMVTSICLSDQSYCDTNYSIFGIGSGFFFKGFRGNQRSDGSYLIDYRALWRSVANASARDINGIWGSSATQAFAVGPAGSILRYDGFQWTSMTSPIRANLNGISGTSATSAFAVGDSCRILQFNGTAWDTMPRPQGVRKFLRAVWATTATGAFAVGDSCTLLQFNGTAWDTLARPTIEVTPGVFAARTDALSAVWASSPTDAFAAGNKGLLLHYDGSGWSPTVLSDSTNLYALWGSSPTDVFAAGDNGKIIRYNGSGWNPMESGTRRRLRAIWGTSSSNVFAAGGGGEILHYDGNAGGQWTEMSGVSPARLRGLWGSSGTDVFAAGEGGAIVHYDGTNEIVDDCLRCRVFLDTGNLSGFRSRYAVTSIDTTSIQYENYAESDVDEIVEIQPSTPPAENLERVAVVPNPYKRSAEWDLPGQRKIHFIHLPDGARVRIFTAGLDLVRELTLDSRSNPGGLTGELEWDMRNGAGNEVKTGIYLYLVETKQGRSRQGHFVIIK